MLVIALLLIQGLYACSSPKQIHVPSNIRYAEGHVVFDAVDNALDYIIEVNGVEHHISTPSFPLDINEVYEVRVMARAKQGFLDSLFSDVFVINLKDPENLVPTNLTLNGSIILWDNPYGANQFDILINNHISVITSLNEFDMLPYYTTPFEAKVRAIYPLGTSNYTSVILLESDALYLSQSTLQYDTFKSSSVLLHEGMQRIIGNIISIKDNQDYDVTNVLLNESKELLSKPYLDTLNTGSHLFFIETLVGVHLLTIIVKNDHLPYLASVSNVYFSESNDATFVFELFDGVLLSIQGNTIETSDYTLDEHGTLTIKSSYMNILFSQPSRSVLILSYSLEKNGQTVIGYLFINRF